MVCFKNYFYLKNVTSTGINVINKHKSGIILFEKLVYYLMILFLLLIILSVGTVLLITVLIGLFITFLHGSYVSTYCGESIHIFSPSPFL
jgi:hypothetical protein